MNRTHREVGGHFERSVKHIHGLRKRKPKACPRVIVQVIPPNRSTDSCVTASTVEKEKCLGNFDAGNALLLGASVFLGCGSGFTDEDTLLAGASRLVSGNRKEKI